MFELHGDTRAGSAMLIVLIPFIPSMSHYVSNPLGFLSALLYSQRVPRIALQSLA